MKIDDRITKLAENILKNSVKLKKGEKIYIMNLLELLQRWEQCHFICIMTIHLLRIW